MKSKDSKNLKVVMEQGTELIEFYRNNPCIAAYDLLGVDFAPIQRVIFEDLWFRNYNITIMSRGCGKTLMLGVLAALSCLLYAGYRVGLIAPVFRQSTVISDTYDTFWTDGGLKTTAQEFYASVEEGVTKTQSLESQNTILSKWQNPERACRSIKTTRGFELAGTADHEILILDDELNLVFKELQEITEEDSIVIKKGFKYFGDDDSMPTFDEFKLNGRMNDCHIPKKLTPDLSYFFGLITGDGCVSFGKKIKGQNRINFTNNTKELTDSFSNIARKYFDAIPKFMDRTACGRSNQVDIYNTKLCYYLVKCGMSCTNAYDKCIPSVIKKASRKCIISFIRGCYDSDGCFCIQKDKRKKTHTMCACLHLSTVSYKLAKEVQAVLLNLGIFSSCETYKGKNGRIDHKVVINNLNEFIKFNNIIGFGCKYKQKLLDKYINKSVSKYSYSIPNSRKVVSNLAGSIESVMEVESDILIYIKQRYKYVTSYTMLKILELVSLAEKYNILTEDYYKLKKIIDLNLSFVKMKESNYFFAPTIDVEVENESCYWSNGIISHNSKMIFAEVEKLYGKSAILREASEKKPTRGPDAAYLKFKSVGGASGSYIEALPLGTDGSKIRGSRFYLLCIDEAAQVPDKILDLVIRPFSAVFLEPMEKVRRLERQTRLIESGLATEDDFEDERANKMILASSGYYKFNHIWKRMQDHWKQIDIAEKKGVESQYAVWQIPYWDLPEGFLDTTNIAEAKRIMSSAEFKMEYEAEMISDSEGFFKASLLEGCTNNSGFSIELKGKAADQYIIGIDPNQGGNASCGIVILKIGAIKHIVNVLELKRLTTQDSTTTVQKLCEDYNIIRIFMDSRGGGNALRDLLEEGYGGVEPIIDRTNPEHKHVEGRHILEMVDFNTKWISDANFVTKALLEDKKLLFPEPPQTVSDLEGKRYENINTLKSQMLSIVVTQTGAGNLHFDTPKKMQNKDLYSAIILAAHGAREFEKEFEEEAVILYNSGGLIRERKPGATFNPITNEGPVLNRTDIGPAILKGKRRIK